MNQNYIVDKLTLSDLTTSGKIVIPSFQRGIVWTKEHRKEFIETVKTGDPFGVVLVSQAQPGEPYILIDGLQRLSTLKAYMSNPLEFTDENDRFIDTELLHKLFKAKYASKGLQLPAESKLDKEKKAFLKKMLSMMKVRPQMPRSLDLWEEICQVLDVPKDKFEVIQCYSEFYQNFVDNLELPDIIIHAIVYQGPQDRLPTVFEHLNTTSVTLSKYEVFSSQWPTIKIAINDEDIIGSVWKKYADLKRSSSFEIDTTEDSIRTEGITLFEYCFALSEILNDENKAYSYMFSKTKKSTDPTGFNLLALICGHPVNRADQICKDTLLGGFNSGEFFVDLKNAIIDAIEKVNNSIKDYVTDLKGSSIKNSSLYQMYHMIVRVFNHLYEIDFINKAVIKKTSQEDKDWIIAFNKYAYKWYLRHRLNNFWNENRQTNDLRRLLDDDTDNEFYVTNISKDTWKDVLSKYISSIKQDATTRIIANDTKLLLNYYYRLLIKEDNNRLKYFKPDGGEDIVFDIEHIAPVDKFRNEDKTLPMSSLGNLCYLPVKDNRSKRNKTIYEYAGDRPSLTFNQEFLDLIDYPSRDDLGFVDCHGNDFNTGFKSMIDFRETALVDKFVELLMNF